MKPIVITMPHNLSTAEAHRRIAAEIERYRSAYVDKLAQSDVTWTGDSADIRVAAFAQQVTAHIDVLAESVRIEIMLPWLLAGLAGPLQERLTASARETLAIGHSKRT